MQGVYYFHMKMKKQKVTLEKLSESVDDLTEIVKEGFGKVYQDMVTKTEFNEFRQEANGRFDDLEIQVGPQGRRLDRLEDKVRQISVKVGLK